MSNQGYYTKHPKESMPILHLPSQLTTDLCLKVCHWALCPTPLSGHRLIPVTLDPCVTMAMAQLLIAYPRNVLSTNER